MSKKNNSRNLIVVLLVVGVIVAVVLSQSTFSDRRMNADLIPITVYKTPTCGCCSKWVRHLEKNGFEVNAINRSNLSSVKSEAGIPRNLASCHTAVVGNYVIEGHVPADDIKRLLKEQPAASGLSVPGMPMGSPGMEGSRKDTYNVMMFTKEGDSTVFSRY